MAKYPEASLASSGVTVAQYCVPHEKFNNINKRHKKNCLIILNLYLSQIS